MEKKIFLMSVAIRWGMVSQRKQSKPDHLGVLKLQQIKY